MNIRAGRIALTFLALTFLSGPAWGKNSGVLDGTWRSSYTYSGDTVEAALIIDGKFNIQFVETQ